MYIYIFPLAYVFILVWLVGNPLANLAALVKLVIKCHNMNGGSGHIEWYAELPH